ncbi:winged helix-turn-helix domain-containing protein [Methanocaldococcus indicus]|uniref:winged helix-turn-helix domain-containing protein n=1 Tax=Methanocaldococcus indicus TaxID=213231 RepID=UPI003C6CCB82
MKVKYKVWIEKDDKFIIGEGGIKILKSIDKHKKLTKVAKELNMSYKFVWNYIKKIENNLKDCIVVTHRGGANKGYTELTERGKELIKIFDYYKNLFDKLLNNNYYSGRIIKINENKIIVEVDNPKNLKENDKIIIIKE